MVITPIKTTISMSYFYDGDFHATMSLHQCFFHPEKKCARPGAVQVGPGSCLAAGGTLVR